jgi:putative flippase GtrA
MGNLTPSSGGPPSRRSRERRALRIAQVGGTAVVVTVVGVVLAIVGVVGAGLPVVAAIVAAVCGVLFRRAVA